MGLGGAENRAWLKLHLRTGGSPLQSVIVFPLPHPREDEGTTGKQESSNIGILNAETPPPPPALFPTLVPRMWAASCPLLAGDLKSLLWGI